MFLSLVNSSPEPWSRVTSNRARVALCSVPSTQYSVLCTQFRVQSTSRLALHFTESALMTVRPFILAAILCLLLHAGVAVAAEAARPNVLFIAVDDLNDWVGCLGGNPQAKTPNIDSLAARGVNFTRAYCASPVCNPSRTALMLGLRSSTTGVYSNGIDRRDSPVAMSVVPLNTYFHQQGYYVAGAGKIYHGDGDQFGEWDDYAKARGGDLAPAAGASGGVGGIRFAPIDAPDEEMPDYRTVSYCIEQLGRKHDKPLFLACGLHKHTMA